jgi:glycosyltransferase involved in cell wall biosynthesis
MGESGRGSEVTFVIPNYNGARYLRQTIESILAQGDSAFQLVVSDNCSTDDSLDLARSYRDPRVAVVAADRHVSMSANWNRCMDSVRTPYFVLAHADDLYDPDYLAVMLPLLRSHERAFMAHCAVHSIDEQGRALDLPVDKYKTLFYPREDPYARPPCEEAAWLRKGNYILAPSAIYRTAHVRSVGGFNERFQFVPDWEYWFRGVFMGFQIAGTRRRLLSYRRHRHSLTKDAESNLSRYSEELELLAWLAPAGHAAGCFSDATPDYGLVSNTLMSEFVDRLSRGDADGAERLAVFARNHVPGFRRSVRDFVMRGARPFGALGGRTLGGFREGYLHLLTWRRP